MDPVIQNNSNGIEFLVTDSDEGVMSVAKSEGMGGNLELEE